MTVSGAEAYNLADDLVDRHVREGRGERLAIVSEGRRVVYRELWEDVNRVAHALTALGVGAGERVLLVLLDSIEFVAAFLGTVKMGAVAVPTNTTLRSADYAYFLEESGAVAAIVHQALLGEVAPALEGSASRLAPRVVVVGDRVSGYLGWDDWLDGQSGALDAAPTTGGDVAFWLWTSGSTGRPKAAVHRHRDWPYCAANYAGGVLGLTASDVTFSSSKLFHAYGLGNSLAFPLSAGAATVLSPIRPQAKSVLEIVQRTRPTLFFSVPTLYAAMLEEARVAEYDLSSVRLAVSAAEPLPADIFRRWKDRFDIEILDGLGSTEVLHIYVSARAGDVRPGSSGTPVPGYDVRVVDAAGEDVPAGAVGDLLVAGESRAVCYWNRPELTAERMRESWFVTGDKYRVDADGYYWYAGRADDMFKVSGQWISPIEIESALVEHASVLEAAVIAFEEKSRLQTAKAFVVLRHGCPASPELAKELQEFVKGRLAPYKCPRRIEFLAELPKSAAGKLLRYKLRMDG
jgi:benzoate-CoA ligase family protein